MNFTEVIIGEFLKNLKIFWWIFPFILLLMFLRSSFFKGWSGEKVVQTRLDKKLDMNVYYPIHNLIIPSRNITTQIDHLYVSPYGVFVLETKNYSGWIFGGEKQAKWTQVIHKKKHSFQNPLRQNYGHIKALSSLLNLSEDKFHSLIIFLGDCQFKTAMPKNVCRANQAFSYINQFQDIILNDVEIQKIVTMLSSEEFMATRKKTKEHIQNIRRK